MKGSNQSMPRGNAIALKRVTILPNIALAFFYAFILLVVLLHFLKPEFDLRERFISEYAVGRYGFIMTIAFLCLSSGSFILAVAVITTQIRKRVYYLISALLFIWSICIAIAAIYPTDLEGSTETATGNIHNNISLLAFVIIVITTFVSLRLKTGKTEDSSSPPMLLPIAVLASFLAMMAAIIVSLNFIGLIQRVFIGMVVIWLIATARKIKFINTIK
jgi:hypothetical protein